MHFVSHSIRNLIAVQNPNIEPTTKDTMSVLHLLSTLVDIDATTPARPFGQAFYGTYCGPVEALKGHTAVLHDYKGVESHVAAQFDRQGLICPVTGALLFIEWHQFDRSHFTIAEGPE